MSFEILVAALRSYFKDAGYPVREIRRNAKRIQTWLAEGRDTHVYFNNDAEGRAPRDARKLLKCL